MQSVIMAGGKGTRLHSLTNDEIPKPMALVCGKPILQWQIECLRENNIRDITIVTGHLGYQISDYFGNGDDFGVNINYFHEETPMGSAGSLAHLDLSGDKDDYFLLVFGDVLFDIYIERMLRFHLEKSSDATLFVHPNSHPFDSDIIILDNDAKVTAFDKKGSVRQYYYDNIVNAGFYILSKKLCKSIPKSGKTDLEKDVLSKLVESCGKIYGYVSTEYIKDVGTPDRIAQVQTAISSGIVKAKNLSGAQKCIFMDRDGTINVYKGLIYTTQEFELEATAAQAIRLINESEYLGVVVTNQPVVARGLCSIEDVEEIHRKMKTLLGEQGAYLDDIEYCPHHPDKGYPEENPDYKIPCDCRKPSSGMITRSAEKLGINLNRSWIIGDSVRDIETGKNAGIKTALVKTGEAGTNTDREIHPDIICENILEAVKKILNYKGE